MNYIDVAEFIIYGKIHSAKDDVTADGFMDSNEIARLFFKVQCHKLN